MSRRFTLLEVVVAIAILALALAGMLQLLTQSQLRIARAEEKWREMHLLIQGAEYLLLAGSEENPEVPDRFFPWTDYRIECTVEDADGLPESSQDLDGQLGLKKWTIRLFRTSDSAERLKVVIDRFDDSTGDTETTEGGNAQ